MADLVISSLRGGQNSYDPPLSLPNDQCVTVRNVEFVRSTCGERRLGSTELDLSGTDLDGHDRVTFLFRHIPTDGLAEAELWALGVTGEVSSDLVQRHIAGYTTITPVDAITLTGEYQYQLQAQSFRGKMFLAYKSDEDRLHVWDGTTLRRAGLAEPAAPTGANDGGAGTFSGTRYYRVRYTVQFGGATLRRSEPSDVLTFVPNGNDTGVVVTKPASIGESETHWELEASLDNVNFYVIATTAVGTTTYTDTNASYEEFELSEDIGDYTVIPSVRYIVVDQDRLVFAGNFEDETLESRVSWTPVFKDPGDGNDERQPIDVDSFIDLDEGTAGAITGMASPIQGYIYVFKHTRIYKLVRTGDRNDAYEAFLVTDQHGALPGSIVTAIDQVGNPAVYFMDPAIGACRISERGVQPCMRDIQDQWTDVYASSATVRCASLYFPIKQQVHWWLTLVTPGGTGHSRFVLQTNETRDMVDSVRRGWTIWTGPSANAIAACLFSANVDSDTARDLNLKPIIGLEDSSLIWRTDTGTTDNGTEYAVLLISKPYQLNNILNEFEVKSVTIAATAADVDVTVDIRKDFGDSVQSQTINLSPAASEPYVVKRLADLNVSECLTLQFHINDDPPNAHWELAQIAARLVSGQTSP